MKCLSTFNRSLAAASLLLPLSLGCGGGTAETTAQSESAPNAKAVSTSGTPQATAATVVDGEGTEPAQSVAIFLDSLRRGDERAANAVLTAKAREEMAKTSYVLQPLGTPEGKFEIGRVGFPYAEKNVALVECTWNEPPVAGEASESMDIVCEVHLEAEGWRISGIGMPIEGTDDALVLDFEDSASLQATIDAATGQAPSPQATAQQTSQLRPSPTGNATTQSNAELPELPSFPGASAEPPADQIALPPLPGAPINR